MGSLMTKHSFTVQLYVVCVLIIQVKLIKTL